MSAFSLDSSLQPVVTDNAKLAHELRKCGSVQGRWAVVRTHRQAERWVESSLQRMGYEVYLPLALVRRKDPVTPTIVRDALVPLFSRYLFVALGHDPWTPIRYTPGVRCLLTADSGRPHMVRAGDIEALQAGEAFRRCPPPAAPSPRPGDALRFTQGPFRGTDCLVVAVRQRIIRVSAMLCGLCVIAAPPEWLGARS